MEAAQPIIAAAGAAGFTLNLDMTVVRGPQRGLGASLGTAAELCTLSGLRRRRTRAI